MMVIATGFIPLCPLIGQSYVGKQQVVWKEYGLEYGNKTPGNMGRCTGCNDIIEIALKMALYTLQSINRLTELF